MILDENGEPFDHRDHCDREAGNGVCYAHMSRFTGHMDNGAPVCNWFAGMWVHDCCEKKTERRERRRRVGSKA